MSWPWSPKTWQTDTPCFGPATATVVGVTATHRAGCLGHPFAEELLLSPHAGQVCASQNWLSPFGTFLQVPPEGAGRAHRTAVFLRLKPSAGVAYTTLDANPAGTMLMATCSSPPTLQAYAMLAGSALGDMSWEAPRNTGSRQRTLQRQRQYCHRRHRRHCNRQQQQLGPCRCRLARRWGWCHCCRAPLAFRTTLPLQLRHLCS